MQQFLMMGKKNSVAQRYFQTLTCSMTLDKALIHTENWGRALGTHSMELGCFPLLEHPCQSSEDRSCCNHNTRSWALV